MQVAWQTAIHGRQSMQSRRGGKQVGHRCVGGSRKTTLRMRLCEQPVSDVLVHWKAEMTDERYRAGRGVRRADSCARHVAPSTVGRFEALQTLNQLDRM